MNKLTLGINKQKAKIMSKMGRLEISHDDTYDELHAKYQHKRKCTQDTVKQFKQVTENLHTLSLSISQLVQGIASTYDNSDPIHAYIEQMSRQLEHFDENYVQRFQKEIQFSCVDPLTNYIVELEAPKQMLVQREKAKMEYDEKSTQMKKLLESKKPTAAQKIPLAREKLQHAESLYNTTRYQAKTQMADLLNSHGKHIDPVLVSLQRSIATVAGGMAKTLGQFEHVAEEIEQQPLKRERFVVEVEEVGEMQSYSSSDMSSAPPYAPSSTQQSSYAPNAPPRHTIPSAPREIPPEFNSEWYYLDESLEQKGPYDFSEMRRMFQSQTIDGSTHVFGGDLSDWLELEQVPGLRHALS